MSAGDYANNLTSRSLAELGCLLRAGEIAPIDIVVACLDRIGRHDAELRSFITVDAEGARSAEKVAGDELAAGMVSALDNAIMLSALAGHDPLDPSSANRPVENFAAKLDGDIRGIRIGVARRRAGTRVPARRLLLGRTSPAQRITNHEGCQL